MTRLEFNVQGSANKPYRVLLEREKGNLNAFCSCPAGSNGQTCKHILRILSGNPEGLDGADCGHLRTAVDWVLDSDVGVALRTLTEAEDRYQSAKRHLADAKKRLSASLKR